MNEIEKALELDPISLIINFGLSLHYVYNGDLDKSISQLTKVMEMDQNLNQAHYLLYQIYFIVITSYSIHYTKLYDSFQ